MNATTFILGLALLILQVAGQHSKAGGKSKSSLARFHDAFNGFYSNTEDISSGGRPLYSQDEIRDTARPVYLPGLGRSLVYFEQVTNGALYRQQLLEFSADHSGTITGIPYNFTEVSLNKPFSWTAEDVAHLRSENLEKSPEECNLVFREVEENVFFGSWPDCTRQYFNGERPVYTVLITCQTFTFVTFTSASREQASLVPYMNRKYSRYPIPPELQEELKSSGNSCGPALATCDIWSRQEHCTLP